MRNKSFLTFIRFCLIIFLTILSFQSYSQNLENIKKPLYLGLNYGQASQNHFPYDNPNYSYSTEFLKVQINYQLVEKKLTYRLLIEPSIYFSEHQLLNKYFIKPQSPLDTENQIQDFLRLKSFREYVLNVGLVLEYNILDSFSIYIMGSVGPMLSTIDTERLKKGFAFSDILGFGIFYKQNRFLFDLRFTIRHNSNANLFFPNNGHNSVGIESGFSFRIN